MNCKISCIQLVSISEWQIGSQPDRDDIFPRVQIGKNTSRSVRLYHGNLIMDGVQNTSITIPEFMIKNITNDTLKDVHSANSKFNIEPGRCIRISLFAVSRSHLKTEVPMQTSCVKSKMNC